MSRFRLTIRSQMALSNVHAACLVVIRRSDWIVAGIADTRITCQETLEETSPLSPVRIAVVLAAAGPGSTEATLHGVSFGFEPMQSERVRERVGMLAAAIKREMSEAAVLQPPFDLAATALSRPQADTRGEVLPLRQFAVAG